MAESPIIGIHLGKTHSYVGVVSNGNISVIKSDANYGIYTNVFVKHLARDKSEDSPLFEDAEFELIDHCDIPKIHFDYRGISKVYDFTNVCLTILRQMKEKFRKFFKTQIKNAVITIPAEFNSVQKRAVNNAAKTCGLNVVKLIDAPAAAVMAFDFHTNGLENENILVLDLSDSVCGGVSVVTVNGSSVRTRALIDWSDFGYRNMKEDVIHSLFDQLEEMSEKFHRNTAEVRTEIWYELMTSRLAREIHLSIENKRFVDDGNVSVKKWKNNVEDWSFRSCPMLLIAIRSFLTIIQFYGKPIYKVLLIGGPCRALKFFQRYSFETPLNLPIGPDEVLAYGAAVQASILTEKMELESESQMNIN